MVTPSFLEFLQQKSLPLAGELNPITESIYAKAKKPVITIFTMIDHLRNEKGFQYIANRIRKLAKEQNLMNKFIFNIGNIGDHEYDMGVDYGLSSVDAKKSYVGLRHGTMYFAMKGTFSVEALTAFIQDYQTGKLIGREKVRKPNDLSLLYM